MTKDTDKGTGKHPHKSSEEPFPHHEGESEKNKQSMKAGAGSGSSTSGRDGGSQQESGSSDLKEREYRDSEGNVHHHTRTYEEQHGKDK